MPVTFTVKDRILIAKWSDPVSVEEASEYNKRVGSLLDDKKPFAILHDSMYVKALPGTVRKELVHLEKLRPFDCKTYIRAMGLAVSSPVFRQLLTAINWMSPPMFEKKMFGSPETAETWLVSVMRASSVVSGRKAI